MASDVDLKSKEDRKQKLRRLPARSKARGDAAPVVTPERTGKQKPRVGVILESLGKYNTPALRYAILRLNRAQSFVEYEIVYDLPELHDFIALTSHGETISRRHLKDVATDFEEKVERLQSEPDADNLPRTKCNRYLAVCNCQLDDNYYLIRPNKLKTMRTLMVGSWSAEFAPPSLLEFIIDICVKQGIAEAYGPPPYKMMPTHSSARGCIFDFNGTLDNTRNGVLIGHICQECKARLALANPNWEEIDNLIGGKWLGDPSDPFSPFSELQRLGFRTFKASGVKDTLWQRLREKLPDQFFGKIIEYVAAGIVLYSLIFLGLNDLLIALFKLTRQ